jgi:hypothetical protein
MNEGPASPPATHHSFVERVMGALRLNATTYAEVEHDPESMAQAAGVVALASVAVAIGTPGGGGVIGATIGGLLGWLVSAGVLWLVGVYILKHTSDYVELLRTIGFASAPQILMVIGIIGPIAGIAAVVVFFWGLAAYVVAAREALDVTTARAVAICLVAFALKIITVLLLGTLASLLGMV